jgi:Domain of unknown function (DUF4404)
VEQRLRADLERLRRELAEGPRLDPESRRLLEDLDREIEDVLESDPGGGADSGLIDRLRAARDRFETSHPNLTELIGGIADLLANMGI